MTPSLASPIADRRRAADNTSFEIDIEATVAQLAASLARTAVDRDRTGGHAAAERLLIRESGLLALLVPASLCGLGASWLALCRAMRRLAQADSAFAHVFGFHHLQVASVLLYGNAEQQQRLLRQTITERLFWGNALNPLDKRLRATPVEGGWRLDGVKGYASGSVGSDRLTFSAVVAGSDPKTAPTLVGNLATRAAGLRVEENWDSFGERQTDSGNVHFDGVFLAVRDVLQAPGTVPTPRASLRQLVSQLTMANVYLGLAQGAFETARCYTLEEARPWATSGVERSADDPYVAKVLAHRAGVEVSSQLFEPTGALDAVGPTSLEIAADDLFGGVGKSGAGKSRCCA